MYIQRVINFNPVDPKAGKYSWNTLESLNTNVLVKILQLVVVADDDDDVVVVVDPVEFGA